MGFTTWLLMKINKWLVVPLIIFWVLYMSRYREGIDCDCGIQSRYRATCKRLEGLCEYDNHRRYYPIKLSTVGGWSGYFDQKTTRKFVSSKMGIDNEYLKPTNSCIVDTSRLENPGRVRLYNHFKERCSFVLLLLTHVVLFMVLECPQIVIPYRMSALMKQIGSALEALVGADELELRNGLKLMASCCSDHVRRMGWSLFFCELYSFLLIYVQFLLFVWYTRGEFEFFTITYGLITGKARNEWNLQTDYISGKFTRVVNCTFSVGFDYSKGGYFVSPCKDAGYEELDMLCRVPYNLRNEQFYLGLFIWTFMLGVVIQARMWRGVFDLCVLKIKNLYTRIRSTGSFLQSGNMHSYAAFKEMGYEPLTFSETWFMINFKRQIDHSDEAREVYKEFIKICEEVLIEKKAKEKAQKNKMKGTGKKNKKGILVV